MSSSNRPCTKAVIAVAGFGTRRLPITKTLEKCLIPIGNRPIVDYIVEDCVKAGITDIIFVVGEQSEQIRTYYGQNKQLETYLEQQGKTEQLQEVQQLAQKARFHFVVQDRNQPYGTAVPIWLARDLIEPDEPFLFLYGDNIYYNQDGSSAIDSFLKNASDAGTDGAMMAVEVPPELVSNYGIVAVEQRNGLEMYQKIVEKPKPEEAPSNLNNAGCFLFKPEIMPLVQQAIEHSPQAERYFIDAVNWYVENGHDVVVIRTKGEYLDCGSMQGWLYANNLLYGTSGKNT
jgi:UTP--glucose-1-phosphate uridylyltransferase